MYILYMWISILSFTNPRRSVFASGYGCTSPNRDFLRDISHSSALFVNKFILCSLDKPQKNRCGQKQDVLTNPSMHLPGWQQLGFTRWAGTRSLTGSRNVIFPFFILVYWETDERIFDFPSFLWMFLKRRKILQLYLVTLVTSWILHDSFEIACSKICTGLGIMWQKPSRMEQQLGCCRLYYSAFISRCYLWMRADLSLHNKKHQHFRVLSVFHTRPSLKPDKTLLFRRDI